RAFSSASLSRWAALSSIKGGVGFSFIAEGLGFVVSTTGLSGAPSPPPPPPGARREGRGALAVSSQVESDLPIAPTTISLKPTIQGKRALGIIPRMARGRYPTSCFFAGRRQGRQRMSPRTLARPTAQRAEVKMRKRPMTENISEATPDIHRHTPSSCFGG